MTDNKYDIVIIGSYINNKDSESEHINDFLRSMYYSKKDTLFFYIIHKMSDI